MRGPTEDRGLIRKITGANPAAGAETSDTVPTGVLWRLINYKVLLTTSATVANRTVKLQISDGSTVQFQTIPGPNHAESLGKLYNFAIDIENETSFDAAGWLRKKIPTLYLPAGWKIVTETTSIAAGDDYGAPEILVEQWVRP